MFFKKSYLLTAALVMLIGVSCLLGFSSYAAETEKPQINDSEIVVFPGEYYKLNVSLGENNEIIEYDYRINDGLSDSAGIYINDDGYLVVDDKIESVIETGIYVDLIYRTKTLKEDKSSKKTTTKPTVEPTAEPTAEPTTAPTVAPTSEPTSSPSGEPTVTPSITPTVTPTPTNSPTAKPTAKPTKTPSPEPEKEPEYEYSESITVTKYIKVTIVPIDYDTAFSPLAAGLSRNLFATAYTGMTFQTVISNPAVAAVSEAGVISGISFGTTNVKLIINVADWTYERDIVFDVTDPSFIRPNDAIAEWGSVSVKDILSGISEKSVVTDLATSNKKKVKVEGETISGVKKCNKVTISCTVDGRPISCTFAVTKSKPKGAIKVNGEGKYYYYSNIPVILQKGKKAAFKASGMGENSHMEFKMDPSTIAEVSEDGVVKAKKYGSTHFTVYIDYREYYVTVVVAKKKVVKVLKKAYTALGKNYSMPRRMEKNYYDCSSLVWRSFSPYGVKFGTYNWAPTAAMEANYMYHHGKMKYFKGVSYKKLKPGDILFFGKCKKGSFGGIHHTAIYVGDNTYIHAAGRAYGVIQSNYTYRKKDIGCIARPLKAD